MYKCIFVNKVSLSTTPMLWLADFFKVKNKLIKYLTLKKTAFQNVVIVDGNNMDVDMCDFLFVLLENLGQINKVSYYYSYLVDSCVNLMIVLILKLLLINWLDMEDELYTVITLTYPLPFIWREETYFMVIFSATYIMYEKKKFYFKSGTYKHKL